MGSPKDPQKREEWISNLRAAGLGKRHTASTKAKMSQAHKGRKSRKHTHESKVKMSLAHMGKKLSPETRAKMSAARIGVKFTPEHRANMSLSFRGKRGKKLTEKHKHNISKGLARAVVLGRRNIRYTRWFHGHLYSAKNDKMFYFRSSWEARAMLCLEFDPDVKAYRAEPFALPYNDVEGKARHYVPDLLVEYCDGRIVLVEVSATYRVKKKAPKIKAGHVWAERVGAKFVVWLLNDVEKMERRLAG